MNEMEWVEAVQHLKGVAALVRAYYDALIEEGFTDEQALALAAAWQHTSLTGGASE